MSTTHQSRRRFFSIIAVLALTLLAPVAVNAQDEVADLAPVAAPAAVGTSVDEVRATRALTAQNALQSGDIGSMQEEALFAIAAASMTTEQTRVLAAQRALQSPDLGSLQEDALTALGFTETVGASARYEVYLLPSPELSEPLPSSQLRERPLRGA
jgi:hypothetical protein